MRSGFKEYHPHVNILFFIGVITFGMLFRHPLYLLVSFASSLAYYLKLTGKKGAKTFFGFLFPMLIFVVIINSFFNHYGVTPLFTLPSGNSFTFEALMMGITTSLEVVSVILWFFCCNEVVTEDKFMHAFGKILPKGALVVSMVLRFVPLYRQRLREVSDAQKGLGCSQELSPIGKLKSGLRNFDILISWSLESAIETADSMKARGYGLKGRTYYSRFQWHTGDTVAAVLIFAAEAAVTVGAVLGATYSIYNPYVIINHPTDGISYFIRELNMTVYSFTLTGIISAAAYFLLCFAPLIIDIKENIKWNRLKSKI